MAGQVMVVTGGSRGIGAATARLAGARGDDVAVNSSASADRAEEIAESLRPGGRRAAATRADDIEALFEETERLIGTSAALVNNAGVSIEAPLVDHEVDAVRWGIETNLPGLTLTSRRAVNVDSERG